jgi:WD40 repeat protein/tetratricopeptide (TPR) repeat protein/tRNA A-37 threonylcarbamoyl transferase component Bud32
MDIEPTLARDTPAPTSAIDGLASHFASEWAAGQRPQIAEFLSQAPADLRRDLLARLMRLELELQSRSGETFAVRNYREQFAEYADVVEQVLAEHSATGSSKLSAQSNASTVGPSAPTDDKTSPPKSSGPASRRRTTTGPSPLMSFGDYEIESEIARGGMGVVYKARQVKLNRTVALKMILAGQFASDEDVQRFYSEAEAAAKLDHPGIVPIYEVDEFDGRHFFSMAFIDGQSLAQRTNQGPLPPREAAQLMKQVADAVHYAHLHGVIHRDLKPRNILLTTGGQPKVTDFGLAKRVGDGSDLTVSGQAIGTPGYMPPEQAAGKLTEIGPRSDVYSLGGVLYCLLTGRPPFQSSSIVETIKQAIETPPVPPRMLNPSVDRDLETICLKCLEKNPAHRYASAADLAAELQRFLDGEPIKALRAGPLTRGWRWLRRRPLVAALGTSLAVLAVVVALSATVAQRALRTYRLTNLQQTIAARIEEPQLTAEWLSESDQLAASLAEFDPELPAEARSRLAGAFLQRIRQEIRRPKLDEQVVAGIETAIKLLEPRDAVQARTLRDELGRRQREWQAVFQLKPPFDPSPAVFPAGAYLVESQRRLLPQASSPLLTTVASEGLVRLEARFDETWETAPRIGLALNAQAGKGYDFVLEISPSQPLTEDELSNRVIQDENAPPPTFRSIRQKDGNFRLAIFRNSRLILEHQLHHSEVPAGPLTLSASREQGELRIQVNALGARTFRDPFPLPARQAGVFGLHWPAGVGLVELSGSEKLRATAVSPLEKGDELYEQGQFAEALESYQRQALETDEPEFLQETQHKQGMCLMNLGRLEEAAARFAPLLEAAGERWPPLAGCYLWVIRLRQKREAEADAIFDTLSTRYRLDQFAALIPQELAAEIRASYQSKLESLSSLMRFNPELVRDHERLAAVDRFFSHDGRGNELVQMEVSRAYHLLGDIPNALQAAENVARGSRHGTVMRHYVRLLRLSGEAQRGLEELQRFRATDTRAGSWENTTLELELARVYAALGKLNESEDVVDEMLRRHRLVQPFEPRIFVYLALIKGMHLDRRGARGPAEEIWREGYLQMRPLLRKQAEPNSEIVNALIVGSLCGDITEEECLAFATGIMARGGDSAFARQAQAMANPQTMARAFKQMWRSPLGRKYAEAFAFETLTLRERVRVPVVLAATEFFNVSVQGGQMTEAQQTVTFDAVGTVFDQAIYEGKLSISQVAQLILAWKGIANFLGWGGVAPSLPPELRGRLAYVLGHRYVALGDLPQAQKFFDTAIQDAPSDSPLGKMATADKQLVAAGQGQLVISSAWQGKQRLIVRQAGKEVAAADVLGEAELVVPAGELALELEQPHSDCRLSQTNLRIAPGNRRQVEIEWLWQPTAAEPLWGLIPQPATAAVGVRWQVHLRHSAQGVRRLAFSGDGQRFAVATADGTIRICDSTSRSLAGILSGAPHDISGLAWAPQNDRLVASGYDGPVSGWDMSSLEQVFRRIEHSGPVTALASCGSQYFSAGGRKSLRIWTDRGDLAAAFDDPNDDAQALAISPDNRWAAVRSWSQGGFAIIRVFDREQENASRVLNDTAMGAFHTLAFSPDGQWLAAGGDARRITVWRTADWSRSVTVELGDGQVNQLAWQSDSRRLLVLVNYNGIHEVDLQAAPAVVTRRWLGPVTHMALSPQESEIIAALGDGTLVRFDLTSDQKVTFGNERREILTLAVQPGGKLIAAAGVDHVLRLLDDQGRVVAIAPPLPPGRQIMHLAWKPDGSLVAGAVNDRSVALWKPDGALAAQFPDKIAQFQQPIAWNAAGEQILLLGEGGKPREFNPAGPDAAVPRQLGEWEATAVSQTKSGLTLLADNRGKVHVLEESGSERARALNVNQHVLSIVPSPAGERAAILDHNGAVSLWDLNARGEATADNEKDKPPGNRLAYFGATHGIGGAVAWSPDGRRIAVSTRYRALQIWDDTGKLLETFTLPHGGRIGALVWLDDGRIVTGGEDGVIHFWDVEQKRATASTVLLASGWARFDAGGKLLDASGAIEEELVYVVETNRSTLDLLKPSEFNERVIAAQGVTAPAPPTIAVPPPMPEPVPAERDEERLAMANLGQVADASLKEISGLARCATRERALWMHNDSGEPLLALVGYDGASLARYKLEGRAVYDWEDMAAFRQGGQDFLLIGDIGDNKANRETLQEFLKLLVLKEPDVAILPAGDVSLLVERTIAIRYEDGQHDCEALAVDAERNVALLLTKELDAECSLYEAPLDAAADAPVMANRIARLRLPLVTAMDISADGRRLAVLGGVHAFEYVRGPEEKWTAALARAPRRYALPALAQPEAIGYDREGKALVVTSEGEHPPLWELKLPSGE